MFRLEFGKPDQRFESFVEVRIKETSSRTADGRTIANGPYVAVYVFEPEANVKHLSFNVTFDELRNYAGMVTYSI